MEGAGEGEGPGNQDEEEEEEQGEAGPTKEEAARAACIGALFPLLFAEYEVLVYDELLLCLLLAVSWSIDL